MTQKEFSSLGLQPETDVVLTLLDGTRKYVRYTGIMLMNALDPNSNRQIEPCFVEAPGRTFSMPLEDIDNIEIPPLPKRIVARLRKTLDGDKPGDTVKVMDAAEDPHGLETGAKIYQIDNVPIFYTRNALVRMIRTMSGDCKTAIPKGHHPIEHKPTIYESPENARFDKNGFEGYAPSQLSDDDLFHLLIHEGYVSYENESPLMQQFCFDGPKYHKISECLLRID